MTYISSTTLKHGSVCTLRSANASDGKEVYDVFYQISTETEYLLSYPDEISFTPEEEPAILQKKAESTDEVELVAVVDGRIVGIAGLHPVGRKHKVAHRAEFWVCILKAYWKLGIGKALTAACIECARHIGYEQLELTVIADNKSAVALYEQAGFIEFGRNPKGNRSRYSGYQEVVHMRLEL